MFRGQPVIPFFTGLFFVDVNAIQEHSRGRQHSCRLSHVLCASVAVYFSDSSPCPFYVRYEPRTYKNRAFSAPQLRVRVTVKKRMRKKTGFHCGLHNHFIANRSLRSTWRWTSTYRCLGFYVVDFHDRCHCKLSPLHHQHQVVGDACTGICTLCAPASAPYRQTHPTVLCSCICLS